LVMDASGNLYGTAAGGGAFQNGVVFEFTPVGKGKWQQHVLYDFRGQPDGSGPSGNLVFDAAGNLYGTTGVGGTGPNCVGDPGCGTVFELSPNGDGSWTESVLYSFQDGSDGAGYPQGLTINSSGSLYGVTGDNGSAIYQLSPPQQGGGDWTETTLYDREWGQFMAPDPVLDKESNLYDTCTGLDCGVGDVIELKHSGNTWRAEFLYGFEGGGNGGHPQAGIIFDKRGQMYGTAYGGGNNWGVVFKLRGSGSKWRESLLYIFCSRNGCADGASPAAPVVFDRDGNLYGTTEQGGFAACPDGYRRGCGVVFKLAPATHEWKETVLHSFKGGLDGYSPEEGVTLDGQGRIFGTTPSGGTASGQGYGTVFEITP